jgi:hypothetical protein
MRKNIDPQTKLGQVNIAEIEFDLRSRDEIPKLLMGLQYIYCTPQIREQVFRILEEMVPTGTDANPGDAHHDRWCLHTQDIILRLVVLSASSQNVPHTLALDDRGNRKQSRQRDDWPPRFLEVGLAQRPK